MIPLLVGVELVFGCKFQNKERAGVPRGAKKNLPAEKIRPPAASAMNIATMCI